MTKIKRQRRRSVKERTLNEKLLRMNENELKDILANGIPNPHRYYFLIFGIKYNLYS